MITLRQLRYLSALARHGHFGRAAEACAVTQPALSMQIRDLERTLGVEVVERRPGEVILTEIGREIARRGEDVLTASRDLVDFARHRGGLLTGRLTLGVIPSLAPYLLPRMLPLLQRRFPELRLELRETQTRQLVDDIKSGALDAAMLALPVGEPRHRYASRCSTICSCWRCRRRSAAARPRAVAVDEIDQSRLILLEDGHCLRDQALAFCATARNRAVTAAAAAPDVRRLQPDHGDADGRGRLRRHADSADRRRRRTPRRPRQIPAAGEAAARPQHRPGVPQDLAAQGGFRRARRGGEGRGRRRVVQPSATAPPRIGRGECDCCRHESCCRLRRRACRPWRRRSVRRSCSSSPCSTTP